MPPALPPVSASCPRPLLDCPESSTALRIPPKPSRPASFRVSKTPKFLPKSPKRDFLKRSVLLVLSMLKSVEVSPEVSCSSTNFNKQWFLKCRQCSEPSTLCNLHRTCDRRWLDRRALPEADSHANFQIKSRFQARADFRQTNEPPRQPPAVPARGSLE